MAQPILMPKFGQTVEECTLVRWLKEEGDAVARGEVLFEIETDKAVLEAESFHEGTLLKIVVPEGGTVPVRSVVAFVGEPGEPVPEVTPPAPAPKTAAAAAPSAPRPTDAPVPGPALAAATATVPVSAAGSAPVRSRLRISPRARRLAREKAIDATTIHGSGPGGRVVERDVHAYLEERGYDCLRLTPAARAFAAEEGVDVLTLAPSGGDARITRRDVEEAIAERPREMSRMRRVIAERLAQSFASTPHFYVTVSADVTDLLALRAEFKAADSALTVTSFVLKAVADSLAEFPLVNGVTDGVCASRRTRVHLGVAVSLETGLVVPVVRDAHRLTLEGLHDAAAALAAKARAGKLTPDEMQGGTFTVSNMGMLDVENFAAIINPGESAILAVASARETPVAVDGRVAVRTLMKMTLSADHRIIDGAEGARFVNAVRARLEDGPRWRNMTSS